MKKLILLSLFLLSAGFGVCAEFDTSIDGNIRKEYVDKSELPPLPSAEPSLNEGKESHSTVTKSEKKSYEQPATLYRTTGKYNTIKGGTKITVASRSAITDTLRKGAIVTFVAKSGFVTKEGEIIPAGTTIRAVVTDSHPPQITSNGGLVELHIHEILYNGVISPINAKLETVNYKHVFGEDIKGKHSYWQNANKALNPGRKFFRGANKCAKVFTPIPIINLLAIVPWTVGATFYAVNLVACPFVALFSKGGRLSIPAGTDFVIKITSDSKISV